jgi:hypothetical protein
MLARIRAALAEEGLHIVRPVSQAAIDKAAIPLSLMELLAGARTGLVIADGGGAFFSRFAGRADRAVADPLDAYTRAAIPAALGRVIAPTAFVVYFPFARAPLLPMQRLGRAAGLPPAGPLGLQIHPQFGPWWAYRAFAVLTEAIPDEPPLASVCEGCPAPCVPACPGLAVERHGFGLERCLAHRLIDPACHHACGARRACPVGAAQAYPAEQLSYHMAASLVHLRRLRPPAG